MIVKNENNVLSIKEYPHGFHWIIRGGWCLWRIYRKSFSLLLSIVSTFLISNPQKKLQPINSPGEVIAPIFPILESPPKIPNF